MAYEDLPLNVSHREPAPPRRGSSPTRWIVIAAGAVVAASLLALWWMSRAQPVAAPPAPTAATEVVPGSNRPKRQAMDLPSLDGSDGFFRELVAALSRHPLLSRLLASKGLVRGAVLAVVQIGDGKTPAVPLAALKPIARLRIAGGAATGRIDPQSYVRWDDPVAALVSISPADAAQLYVNVKQLFDEAYRELGNPGGDFDQAIVRAIRTLNATPDVTVDPVLLSRPGYFEHDDPALRSLQPVQKQLLLTGPQNRKRLIGWLDQFARNLDLKTD